MIIYMDSLDSITPDNLRGFFVGWPNPPAPDTHLRLLQGSFAVVLALNEGGAVVGFITAMSDGVSAAYIPHLEVLPEYQHQGIGSQLVQLMLEKLRHLYMIDLTCDPDLQPFYAQFGMQPYSAMILRNYKRQAGE